MKHTTKLALIAITASLALPSALLAAEPPVHELSGSSAAVLSFASGTDTAFTAAAGYSYLLMGDWLQGTAVASFFTQSGASILTVVVGPTLNYSIDNGGLDDAFYLNPAIGAQYTNAVGGSTNFAHRIELGKRFTITQHVQWKPAFIASGVSTSGGSNPEQFRVVPAQFAVLF